MLSGRLKAVLVATLATIVLVGALGPSPTLAGDPPGLGRFMAAMGRIESGGNYHARNPRSGAYGKYQIMPSSWRAWAARYLGSANARPTPANQEIVAAAKFRALYKGLHSWRRVAYWWLTGSSRSSGWSSTASRYVKRVLSVYNATKKPIKVPVIDKGVTLKRFSETSSLISYSGTWRSAGYQGYAGDAAKYSTRAGDTATFTFTGRKVVWYGPVGPTRGQARILVDGSYLKTVNLNASHFDARTAIFSRSWKSLAKHTLTIEVVGTAGHPYVAIDELAVAR